MARNCSCLATSPEDCGGACTAAAAAGAPSSDRIDCIAASIESFKELMSKGSVAVVPSAALCCTAGKEALDVEGAIKVGW